MSNRAGRRHRGRALLAGLVVGGALTGCAPDAPATPEADAADPSLPVETYLLTEDEKALVHEAAQLLTARCMESLGRPERLPDLYSTDQVGRIGFLDRRYAAVYDIGTARRYGLHVPQYVEHPSRPAITPLPKAAERALYGAPAERHPRERVDVAAGRLTFGGCLGQAEAELAAGTRHVVGIGQTPSEPVRRLDLDDTPSKDPAVVQGQEAWSACMSERGYRLASTIAPVDDVPGVDVEAPYPSEAEIDLAVAGVDCQHETGVVETWFQVEKEYQAAQIRRDAALFQQVRDENALVVERATATVRDLG